MRKSFKWIFTASLAAFAVIGCAKQGDLDKLGERIDGIENRVSALEDAVKQLNETEIPNLQGLVRALEGNVTVKSVVETEDGYTITFSDGTIAELKNGADGKDGVSAVDGVGVATIEENENGYLITFTDGRSIQVNHGVDGSDGKQVGVTVVDGVYVWTVDGEVLTDEEGNPIPVTGAAGTDGTTPTVGITLEDGVYVWTVNGEVLKDDEGNSIPVAGKDGITPQFGIFEGTWIISYDNGENWKTLGLTVDTDYSAYLDPDKETDDYIVLVVGATEVQIPKEKPFALIFSTIENNGVIAGEEVSYPYTITGVNATDETDVDIIGIIGDWTAEVVPTGNAAGALNVKVTENTTAKITVYAANHKGKTDIRTLKFEEGVLEAIIETKDIDWEGGELDLAVKTNRAYEIYVPADAQDWITVTPETKVRTDNYTITVAKNETGAYRQATLKVLNQAGKSIKDIEILQYANPNAPVDLASVLDLPDDQSVVANGLTVVAASKASTIVTDGETFSYVAGYTGEAGTVIDVTGTKKTDDLDLPYIEATDVKVNAEAEAVEVDKKDYYMYIDYGDTYFYTAYNGVVSLKDGVYHVTAGEEPSQFIVENPVQDMSGMEGKLVALSGWVKVIDYQRRVKNDLYIVLTDVHEVSFTEEAGWKPYYGGPNSGDSSYPEIIGNEVSAPQEGVYYCLNVLSADDVEAYGSLSNALLACFVESSDFVLSYLSYYQLAYGLDYDTAFGHLAYADSEAEKWSTFDYGSYYAVAVGVDAEGRLSGKYAVSEFEKKDPSVFAKYEDFLGEWALGSASVEITEKVKGETYSISGLPGYDGKNYPAVEAVYDSKAGKFTLKEQELLDYTSQYGPAKRILAGVFAYGSDTYSYFWFNSESNGDVPQLIFTASLMEDGTISLVPGNCPYGSFVGFNYAWVITSGNYARQGNVMDTVALPNVMTPFTLDMEAYNAWLGSWKFGDQTWTIETKEAGKTYSVNGIGGIDFPFSANFNASTKEFELHTQANVATIELTDDTGSAFEAEMGLFGNIRYQGTVYYWGDDAKIASAALSESRTATLTPAVCSSYGNFIGFTIYGETAETAYALCDFIALPLDVKAASGASTTSVSPYTLSKEYNPVGVSGKTVGETLSASIRCKALDSDIPVWNGKSMRKAVEF